MSSAQRGRSLEHSPLLVALEPFPWVSMDSVLSGEIHGVNNPSVLLKIKVHIEPSSVVWSHFKTNIGRN